MKFKYTGADNFRCFDLAIYGVASKRHRLNNGDIVEIPETDKNQSLIRRMKVTAIFEPVTESKNMIKSKKIKTVTDKSEGDDE